MLKLKKVELLGFKSFCERTEMHFNGGGIAAIVGPNGCGKSNFSDAISWVLGEQSAKLLRGARMEDVIFNGTRERPPLGMATATLTLIDPEVFFSVPAAAESKPGEKPGEITVTRRLFRSGDSEYLLNGRLCRLRDIQELFMGTGLGPESYAIIEQGRIGQILSSRPHDRRALIEEAAGITRFKTKKRLAEARLEGARQNLARVVDILEEVGRQVNSLKRQAAKARRYEELRKEMTARLAVALGGRHQALDRQAVQAALDLNFAAEDCRSLSDRSSQFQAEHAAVQKESFDLEAALQQRREELASASIDADRARQRLDYQARQAEENAARVRQAETELAALDIRLRELGADLAAERASSDQASADAASARELLTSKSAALDSLHFRLQEREAEQERHRQGVLRLLGEASTLRNQVAQIEEFLAGLDRQGVRVRAEEAAALDEQRQLTAERRDLLARLQHQQLEIESLADRRRRLEEALAQDRAQAQARRDSLDARRADHSRLEARRQSLDEILSHRAYTTDTVKNLFAALQAGRLGSFRPRGILADFLDVDPAWEKAAESFLREELDYIVVESFDAAEQGLQVLRTGLEGQATFLVQPPEQVPEIAHHAPESGITGRLRDHINPSIPQPINPAILPRLARCYLVDSESSARRLAARYSDLYFLLPDGACYHGYTVSGGCKSSSGPLALKRELRELAPRLTALTHEIDEETAALAALDDAIARQSAELEAVRAATQVQEKTTLAAEHDLRQINERLNRANSHLSVAGLEIKRLGEEAARAAAERDHAVAGVVERDAARARAEESLSTLRVTIAAEQAEAAQAAAEQAELLARLAGLEERRKGTLAAAARLAQLLAEHTARRDDTARHAAASAAECQRLLDDNRSLALQIEVLDARRASLEAAAQQLDATLQQRRARLAAIEESAKALQAELDAARERRSAAEISLVRLQSDIAHLAQTCQNELGRPIAELAAADLPAGPEAVQAAEQEYLRVKEKIESLGPINALALEEYREAQQRFEFLETQRKDLYDAIRDTQQAISEIDSVSRKQFQEAFEEINKNFRQTFSALFGGGSGEMRLTDETDLAESGIDIVASPPGKKLQNVLLLSGGEKALTAIALLMAVFRYTPSPFCILDEVDAPLDEPNIARFTRLIRQMSGETQFILITHNRSTMEVAETLYGVTMQEPGVSKLVSVKLARSAPQPPAPPIPVVEEAAELAAIAGD